jgi:hypothetical protein
VLETIPPALLYILDFCSFVPLVDTDVYSRQTQIRCREANHITDITTHTDIAFHFVQYLLFLNGRINK